MNKKIFLFLGIFAVLAVNSTAQSNTSKYPSGPNVSTRLNGLEAELTRFLESNDDKTTTPDRPRVVENKASGVNASVIINIGSVERIAFRMLNQKRAENSLKPLMWSDDLERIARIHSQNMADFKFFSHQGIDGRMVSDRADCLGVSNWRSIGENIAYNRGYKDPIDKAVELWLDSPAHRHNLMAENWKESAVGVAVAPDGSYYFTQVFLQRK